MNILFLALTHLSVVAAAGVLLYRQARTFQKRADAASEAATDRLLRELALAEMHGHRTGYDKGEQVGFDKGRVNGVAVGISLRDQIDEIGDYSQ